MNWKDCFPYLPVSSELELVTAAFRRAMLLVGVEIVARLESVQTSGVSVLGHFLNPGAYKDFPIDRISSVYRKE